MDRLGRFCRRSPSPSPQRPQSDFEPLSGRYGGPPAHPGPLLVFPQGRLGRPRANNLLFFRFAQDVAHTDEGYFLASGSTSPSLILLGRFQVTLIGRFWGPLMVTATSGAFSAFAGLAKLVLYSNWDRVSLNDSLGSAVGWNSGTFGLTWLGCKLTEERPD